METKKNKIIRTAKTYCTIFALFLTFTGCERDLVDIVQFEGDTEPHIAIDDEKGIKVSSAATEVKFTYKSREHYPTITSSEEWVKCVKEFERTEESTLSGATSYIYSVTCDIKENTSNYYRKAIIYADDKLQKVIVQEPSK